MVKKYSREFREDAMKLASEIGVRKTSEKLDVSPKTLYAWQRKERLSRGIAMAASGRKPGGWNETAGERKRRAAIHCQRGQSSSLEKESIVLFSGGLSGSIFIL